MGYEEVKKTAIVIPSLDITAQQVAAILGMSIGYLWGQAFMGLDGFLKYNEDFTGPSEFWKNLKPWEKFLYGAFLDTQHHFQYGLILLLFAKINAWLAVREIARILVLYIGSGMIVSDWKNFEHVLERMNLLELFVEKEDE